MKALEKQTIKRLIYLLRVYDGINKLIVGAKNRLLALSIDADPEDQKEIGDLVKQKNRLSYRIEKELKFWDIWNRWLSKVVGAGAFTAGNLIILYYYRLIPICAECKSDLASYCKKCKSQIPLYDTSCCSCGAKDKNLDKFKCSDCGRKAKGDGSLIFRIEKKDFPNVSKWWAYLGRDIKDGAMRKRESGEQSNWSSRGRTVSFQFSEQANIQADDHPYKAHLLKMKAKHSKKNDDREKPWTKGHIHNAAKNETAKLFLSHFWHVAREIEGKSTDGPYVGAIEGHTGIIAPYYWE